MHEVSRARDEWETEAMVMRVSRSEWDATAGEVDHLPGGPSAQTGGEWFIRPASRTDAPGIQAFVRKLSPETRRKRFFGPIIELSAQQLERLTSCATADDLNLLVLDRCGEIIGMAQCVTTSSSEAEFALVVSDNWQRRGIGTALSGVLFEHARERHLASLAGFVLSDNQAMLGLAAKLGFSLARDTDATLTRAIIAFAHSPLPAPGPAQMDTPDHAGLAA
jgi:acetyltransferase